MDNKKFEQLIELIINENEDKARALFHDIVVEKSREIYENIIAEEMDENQPAGQVMDMLDEIGVEESGVVEGDEEEEGGRQAEGRQEERPTQGCRAESGRRRGVNSVGGRAATDGLQAGRASPSAHGSR